MSKDPIIPSRASRPGGRNLTGEPAHYMEALQNRNKTNLLEALGSTPPLVEEIEPETPETFHTKKAILKAIKTTGHYLGQMSGLTQMVGGIQSELSRVQNKLLNRILYSIEDQFAPMQAFFRGIEIQYTQLIAQYETGAAIGSLVGGALGYALGYIYLGPLGASILGPLAQIVGGGLGAMTQEMIEDMPNWTMQDWMDSIWGTGVSSEQREDLAGWYPHTPAPAPPPHGGMPQYRTTNQTNIGVRYTRKYVIPQLINKMNRLEERLY